MTEPRDHCSECGRNFKKRDFSTDWLGRVILDGHRCDPADIQRFQAQHDINWLVAKTVKESVCEACGKEMRITTYAQRFCSDCAKERRHAKERARIANAKAQRLANIAKAMAHPKCLECKRPQAKGSERCAYHTRKWLIRTGQWDWDAV